ncbi:MAG TPA: hypothetical protein VMG58_09265, partial [Candidatus Sulfotelmatobacter sp.]|nr:hypothetical protein [Candidatus Sulfotelmatobacter sp.]
AAGEMDLLTVVTHELGHVLGYSDVPGQASGVMAATLEAGVRRTTADPTPATAPATQTTAAAADTGGSETVGGLIDWGGEAGGTAAWRNPLTALGVRHIRQHVPDFAPGLAGDGDGFAREWDQAFFDLVYANKSNWPRRAV